MSDPRQEFNGPAVVNLSTGTGDSSGSTSHLADFLRLVEDVWSKLPGTPGSDRGDDSATPPPVLPVGAGGSVRIGRFEIGRELGRGGGGIVLMAFDPLLRRTVALKVPGPQALASLASRDRFLSEARAAATLRHTHVVAVHEAGEAGGIPYIVMDYCEAGSLADWLAGRPDDRPIPIAWAARLMVRIANGVQHAHDRQILHRDLKPSNILLQGLIPAESSGTEVSGHPPGRSDEPELVPKVADFGLAKIGEANEAGRDGTLEGVPLGTLPYMAAEAARGDGQAIGPPTDVYGLGVILFELLTRRRPFSGKSHAELLDEVRHAEPPSPRQFRRDLPVDLETICLTCLRKQPRERYQRPSELADELERFLDHVPILARPTPIWRKTASQLRRHPVRSALAGLAVLSIVGIIGVAFWLSNLRLRDQTDVLIRHLETADIASLPDLVRKLDPSDPRIVKQVENLYASGTPAQKLAAALVLVKARPDLDDYCHDQLLQAAPREVEPIARLLNARMPKLTGWLEKDVIQSSEPDRSDEAQALRRANASCALLSLGNSGRGWSLFQFAPDPEARSFLIHRLGPAGIAPLRILERIVAESDPSIRRGLIQALGEVPEGSWNTQHRDRARTLLMDLYERDPDPGIHGSCKWVLLRWGQAEALRAVDTRLSERPQPSGRRWRISPMGLTFVAFHDPNTKRVVEVSDSEVTVAQFLKFRPGHKYESGVSPSPDHPINSINYIMAAEYCNWLSDKEGIAPGQKSYQPGIDVSIEPVDHQLDREGYRLLTEDEFEVACRAGVKTVRYHGSSSALLSNYAWYGPPTDLSFRPVCRLKPNDLGLFDMLGNAHEVCQASPLENGPQNQATFCGGSVLQSEFSIRCDRRLRSKGAEQTTAIYPFGFHVARTKEPSK